jgi:hypothetical protein
MAAGATSPAVPGYHVLEQRCPQGMHGGLATYYRQSLQLESTQGNEYGLHTKLILPTSERISIVNAYLLPTSLLARCNITEAHTSTQLELVLELVQPQLTMVICGNFNTRIGTRISALDHPHPPCHATDTHVCPHATWFLNVF